MHIEVWLCVRLVFCVLFFCFRLIVVLMCCCSVPCRSVFSASSILVIKICILEYEQCVFRFPVS